MFSNQYHMHKSHITEFLEGEGEEMGILSLCIGELLWLTCGVLKDLNGSIVDLSNGLHLNVVAIATVKPLPVDVVLKILISNIL